MLTAFGLLLVIVGELGVIFSMRMKLKKAEQLASQQEIEKERYQIAAEITNDILFEYDMEEDTMEFPEKYVENFGRGRFQEGYVKKLREIEYVHEEDYSVFTNFAASLQSGNNEIEAEFRMLNAREEYVWCRLRGKTIYNSNGAPAKIIGKIVNIDIQKKELEKLELKSQMDPLTNAYNKTATKDKINEKIIASISDEFHALLIIDIDDFKQINDTHGHLLGDQVLVNVVSHIRKMFREEDVVGRIGGDEFVVFMNHVTSREDVANKVLKIFQAFRNRYREKDMEIDVTGSIGISIYPMDGENYDELLEKADKALYEVKAQGKNSFNIYAGTE